MGNKFLRLFLIVISSFAASVGLASCSVNNMFHRLIQMLQKSMFMVFLRTFMVGSAN